MFTKTAENCTRKNINTRTLKLLNYYDTAIATFAALLLTARPICRSFSAFFFRFRSMFFVFAQTFKFSYTFSPSNAHRSVLLLIPLQYASNH